MADIRSASVDRRICLGDIVGYGAEPVACVETVSGAAIDTVLGNHDSAALGETPLDYFNPYAKAAAIWTADELDDTSRSFLRGLPLTRDYDDFTIVHATLERPRDWGYIMDQFSALQCFARLNKRLCFIGHSHVPLVFIEKEGLDYLPPTDIQCRDDSRYIVNIGSVGQPRDGDPRASYVIYDDAERNIEFRRVAYDIAEAQRKIIDAGLPAFLAQRLETGH